MPRILLVAFIFFVTMISFKVSGQEKPEVKNLSNGTINEFYDKARANGMSEIQIEHAALKQGYTLTDIANMRKKITDNKLKTTIDTETADDLSSTRQQNKTGTSNIPTPKVADNAAKFFGASFFEKPFMTFEPNLRIATPKNYQLGPDDVLNVEIYGASNNTYKLVVSPEGTVRVRELAPIFVSGLTVEEAREKIVGRLRSMYAGLNMGGGTSVTVTLGNIRSIKVFVTGQAQKPGTYTVSSFATAFNALVLCGGPTEKGSLRNIKVIRNNKEVRNIDFYDFLLNSDQSNNVMLQDQDIIYIPYYKTKVSLTGHVKEPAIFEVKDKETFEDILVFSGNFADVAYKDNIEVERITDKERKLITLNQEEYPNFIPQTGDIYRVSSVLGRFENQVMVAGSVFRPGKYAIDSSLSTLKQLIKKAEGFREDALRYRVEIHRNDDRLEPILLVADFEKIEAGELPDITLKRDDSVAVKSIKDLKEAYFVSIVGAVNAPNKFPFKENQTVSDLVVASGGFTEGAIGSRIEIARRIKMVSRGFDDEKSVEIITLKIDKELRLTPNDAEFKLQPFDVVYIRKLPSYEIQKNATILGEVYYPGTYAIVNNSERISNLIERAGQLKTTGYLPAAMLLRNGEKVAIDIDKILNNPGVAGNLLLERGDTLYIPKKNETVRIEGAVLNPSIINFEKSFTFKDYLSQAGGFDDNAIRRKPFVKYANGYTKRTKSFLFFRQYPTIEPGALISVPFKPKKEKGPDYTPALITVFTTSIIILLNKFLQ